MENNANISYCGVVNARVGIAQRRGPEGKMCTVMIIAHCKRQMGLCDALITLIKEIRPWMYAPGHAGDLEENFRQLRLHHQGVVSDYTGWPTGGTSDK